LPTVHFVTFMGIMCSNVIYSYKLKFTSPLAKKLPPN